MTEPWTPGPWHIEKAPEGENIVGVIFGGDGFKVAEVEWPQTFSEGEVNRRLIAAAPEMAELLAWFATHPNEKDDEAAKMARALLARIRGEA